MMCLDMCLGLFLLGDAINEPSELCFSGIEPVSQESDALITDLRLFCV